MHVIALVLMLPPPATPHPDADAAAAGAAAGSSSGSKRSSSSSPAKIVKLLIWDDKHPAAKAAAAAAAAASAAAAATTDADAAGAGAAAAGPVPPAAAAGAAGMPVNATSTTAADAAARAAAKQLHQLPSLSAVDDPVCVCPPGRDWDGLLGALSLNGSLHWLNSAKGLGGGKARVVRSKGDGKAGLESRHAAAEGALHQQHQQQQQQAGLVSPRSRSNGTAQEEPTGAAAAVSCTCERSPLQLQYYASELALLQGFCAVVQALDPDVIVGWDIQQGSLGYLADRGLQLGFNVLRSASKTPEVSHGGMHMYMQCVAALLRVLLQLCL